MTGGLSSGKTSVCQIFKQLGANVISADEIVHQLLTPDTLVGQKVIDLFGPDVVIDNQIDRSQIAKRVFCDLELLAKLEQIIHPAVREMTEREIKHLQNEPATSLIVVEIPLLFEGGMTRQYDAILVVSASEELCQKRFAQGKKAFTQRMARQLPQAEKVKRADYVIENNGSLEDLKQTVTKIYKELTGV